MKTMAWKLGVVVGMLVAIGSGPAMAFDSGSTGALGALTPGANMQIPLPEDGVLHYTEVLIPAGVTVSFIANERNTPVYLLASGNVTINGTIDVAGKQGTTINKKHITHLGGLAGPGGSPGGSGRDGQGVSAWADGLGPGAGLGSAGLNGNGTTSNVFRQASGGASHISPGLKTANGPAAPAAHSSFLTWALHGGSGGGVGYGTSGNINDYSAAANTGAKTSGGGGGGALTVAASGTITIAGSITANGGPAWGGSAAGGGGSIRLVAPQVVGNGILTATSLSCPGSLWTGACGGNGFILVEAYDMGGAFTTLSNPALHFGEPRPALPFVQGEEPTLRIVSIGGQASPIPAAGSHPLANPTLTIQQGTTVAVLVEATNVPVGTPVKVGMNRLGATRVVVDAPPLAGTTELSTTTVNVSIPAGTRVGAIEAWIPSFATP